MDDLDILEEMIKAPPIIPVRNGVIKLKEKQKNADYTVTITGAPDNCVVIKADTFDVLIPEGKGMRLEDKQILKGYNDIGKEIRKKADYIIVCDDGEQKRIFYIELKQGRRDIGPEIRKKLKGAKCLMEYFKAIGIEFWGQEKFLNSCDYEVRYIGFVDAINKRGRIKKNYNKGNSPEEFFEFRRCPKINFQALLKPSCE